jgi:hypothetical protein
MMIGSSGANGLEPGNGKKEKSPFNSLLYRKY